jgi:hypothetical protein
MTSNCCYYYNTEIRCRKSTSKFFCSIHEQAPNFVKCSFIGCENHISSCFSFFCIDHDNIHPNSLNVYFSDDRINKLKKVL